MRANAPASDLSSPRSWSKSFSDRTCDNWIGKQSPFVVDRNWHRGPSESLVWLSFRIGFRPPAVVLARSLQTHSLTPKSRILWLCRGKVRKGSGLFGGATPRPSRHSLSNFKQRLLTARCGGKSGNRKVSRATLLRFYRPQPALLRVTTEPKRN